MDIHPLEPYVAVACEGSITRAWNCLGGSRAAWMPGGFLYARAVSVETAC